MYMIRTFTVKKLKFLIFSNSKNYHLKKKKKKKKNKATQKTTLFILTTHFTIHSISKVLF